MSSLRGYGCNGGSGYWRPPDQRRELSTGPFSWWQRQTSRPCGGLVSGGRNRWANTHAVVAVGFPTSVGKKQPVRQTGKKILSMAEGERVASILPVSEFAEDHYLLMLTVNGCIMTVPLKLFSRMHSSGIIEIQLDKESTAETKLVEAKKQYDLMLESKQLELSRHLKELSQRNDQAINDIRRKYDVEKQEIISSEKDKVKETIKELSTKYDEELSDCKEESKRQLLTIQEEHASLIILTFHTLEIIYELLEKILSIREEHESKELNLKAKYDQELRKNQIQAESELKERITALKSEHDVQLKAFKCQYEDDCKKLQEELDLQRKKNYSVSKDSRFGGSKRREHIRVRADNDDEQAENQIYILIRFCFDSRFVKAKETPVSKILKKAQNVNTGSVMSIPSPKYHSKVTHRDYEVEMSNGRIPKRRKTRNAAMFMNELSLKLSSLEMESKEKYEKRQADAQKQFEELEALQKESESHELQADLLAKEVNQLQAVIEEKGHLIHQCNENEKKLNQQIIKDKELLSTAETKLVEAQKQYDLMLESKLLELSRHLKELSQRNDQAINDIRRKYDVEKQEIISSEKDKVEKTIKELSTKYDKELSDCKEESKRQLLTIQEEHASLILSIREEHESKELNLKAKYDQELRQNQIQAENELKERITALKSEHDVQLKAFKCQYEDDCKKLQEELDLQRKKEEKQRALVQLQWKVMSDNPPEEQEVNSNKVPTLSINTKGVTAMGLKKADKMASLDTSSLRKDMVEKSEETSNEKPYKGDASLLGRLKMGVEKQLSQYEVKAEWSIVVPPGRYVSVNPGEGNLVAITEVRFNSPNRPDNDMICADGQAPHCQVYLGINRTREEFVLIYLNTVSQPRRELHVPLYLTEGFTIGHAAYSEICFSGFRYGEQPEPQPLLGEEPQVSWPFDVGVTAMILSKFGGSARVARAELVCKLFDRAGRPL
ncbi:unnamed protein product [Arabidopsis halleri]